MIVINDQIGNLTCCSLTPTVSEVLLLLHLSQLSFVDYHLYACAYQSALLVYPIISSQELEYELVQRNHQHQAHFVISHSQLLILNSHSLTQDFFREYDDL